MAHDAQWNLLSHIVQHQSLRSAMARKIEPDFFSDPLAQKSYAFISRHYAKYKKVPSLALLSKKFKRGRFTETVEEPVAYYLDEFVRQYLRTNGAEILVDASRELADDPMRVLDEVRQRAASLLGQGTPTEDVEYSTDWRARLKAYRKRKKGEMTGIPTPFATWNDMCFGYQPQDYILITARPGVGKTFFMLLLAQHAAREQKKNVLFFTKEMSITAMTRRSDAMWYGLSYNAFRRGTLADAQERAYIKGLKETSRLTKRGELGRLIFVSDAYLSISAMDAKIDEYNPDLIIVDGLYLMRDFANSGDQHVRVSNVSREARSLAQAYNKPLIATSQIHRMPGNAQTNWRNLSLDDLAFSDALSQDARQAFALVRTEDMRERNHLMIKCLKMDESDPRDFGSHWDLNSMQNTFYEIPIDEEGNLNEQVDRDSETGKPIPNNDDVIADGWKKPTDDEDED